MSKKRPLFDFCNISQAKRGNLKCGNPDIVVPAYFAICTSNSPTPNLINTNNQDTRVGKLGVLIRSTTNCHNIFNYLQHVHFNIH